LILNKKFEGSPSIIKEMSLKRASVIDFKHCIDKTILCEGNAGIAQISDEFLNSLGVRIKVKWRSHSTWDFSEDTFPKGF
jgi:hypothetical protein